MGPTTLLQADVRESFRPIDVPDDRALKAAVALSSAMSKVEDETQKGFSRRDAGIEVTRKDVQALKVDMAVLKWKVGFVLPMNVAILF